MQWIRLAGVIAVLIAACPALAFGPSMGADADIGQLAAAGYGGDAASNAPGAGGDFTDLTAPRFTPAPTAHVPRRPTHHPRILITP
jgi:hypothetical protein